MELPRQRFVRTQFFFSAEKIKMLYYQHVQNNMWSITEYFLLLSFWLVIYLQHRLTSPAQTYLTSTDLPVHSYLLSFRALYSSLLT